MATKTTSCFTSLKEALILPTRNPKLFALVLLLLAVTAFLVPLARVMSVKPLTDDMARASHLTEIKNTGAFSAEYARLLNEIKHDVMKLTIISISLQVVTPALRFVKQITTFLAAYFGDLAELMIHKVIKWNSLQGPSITIAVVALLGALVSVVMHRRLGVLSLLGLIFLGLIFLLAFLAAKVFATGASIQIKIEYICS
jgi:hypothetical protein